MSLLSCLQIEIYIFEVHRQPSCIFHFRFLLTSNYHQYNIGGMFVAESIGVAVGSLCRTEDILRATRCSQHVFTTSGFEPPNWLYGEWYRLVLLSSFCSSIIFRKSTIKAFPLFSLTPSGNEMAAKTVIWAGYFYPLLISNTKSNWTVKINALNSDSSLYVYNIGAIY